MKILIACCKKKRNYKCRAEELYDSPLFKYSLKYAKQHANSKDIYILSGKYGLLKLNNIIEPYNITLNTMTDEQIKQWSSRVINQMENEHISKEEKIIFLCGTKYYKYLSKVYNNYELPLKNLGLGKRLQWLKQHIK